MSDAAKIIDKLTRTYPCAARGCDGTVGMALRANSGGPPRFTYQCDTCGAQWHQNGHPVLSPEADQ
jgi:hypothetical protein